MSASALQVLDDRYDLTAPDLIRPEVGSLAWKLHARGVLNVAEAQGLIMLSTVWGAAGVSSRGASFFTSLVGWRVAPRGQM